MCSDGFCLARPLQHKELRKDGDGLEVNGEGPKDLLDDGEEASMFLPVVEDKRKECGRSNEILESNSVDSWVMGWSVVEKMVRVCMEGV